jgi:tyrosine-protein kinase
VELRDFFQTIQRHRTLVLVVFLLIVGMGAAAAFLRTERYEATATIIAQPASGRADFNSVENVRFLLPSIVEQVSTDSFRSRVRQSLPSGLSLSGVKLNASVEQGTGILRIKAEGTRRDEVTPIANGAAKVLVDRKIAPTLTLAVIDPAHRAKSASAGLRAPILASSIIVGLIFGVFFALMRDAVDQRFRSNEDIYERLGLEVLGEIPVKRKFPRSPVEIFSSPKHAQIAEGYQRLVTSLEITLSQSDVRTIAITSCASNEGKTTVTASLAWAAALLGHDVIAIDGDLRKPNLHSLFGIAPEPGLANAAVKPAAKLLQATPLPSLSVIPAGRGRLHPTQLVNQHLGDVLESFPDRLILLDSPPMLAAAEATLIAMVAKNVVLVIDRTSRGSEEIERVLHDLRRANVNILGVVVNRAKVKRSSGYDDYYVAIRQPAEQIPRSQPRRVSAGSRTRSRARR